MGIVGSTTASMRCSANQSHQACVSSVRPAWQADVFLGRHRPSLRVLEPSAIRRAVSVPPVVEATVVDEHLGEDEIEEVGRTSSRAGGVGGSTRSPGSAVSARSKPAATSGSSSAIRGETAYRRSGRRSRRGSVPAIAAKSGSQSPTVRAIGPGWSKVGRERHDSAHARRARVWA